MGVMEMNVGPRMEAALLSKVLDNMVQSAGGELAMMRAAAETAAPVSADGIGGLIDVTA